MKPGTNLGPVLLQELLLTEISEKFCKGDPLWLA